MVLVSIMKFVIAIFILFSSVILFSRQTPEIGSKNKLFDWAFKNAKKSYMIVFHRNQKFSQGMEWRFCSKCSGLSMKASVTSLLMHTVAHSTMHSFRPKTNNQPLKKN